MKKLHLAVGVLFICIGLNELRKGTAWSFRGGVADFKKSKNKKIFYMVSFGKIGIGILLILRGFDIF